jgi:hypothetical protein
MIAKHYLCLIKIKAIHGCHISGKTKSLRTFRLQAFCFWYWCWYISRPPAPVVRVRLEQGIMVSATDDGIMSLLKDDAP